MQDFYHALREFMTAGAAAGAFAGFVGPVCTNLVAYRTTRKALESGSLDAEDVTDSLRLYEKSGILSILVTPGISRAVKKYETK